jgi:hypothetical protein
MTDATEKQVIALKRFARNPELSQGILKSVSFDDLSKKEASELIKECYAKQNDKGGESATFIVESNGSKGSFSQNYRKDDGNFGTITLTDEELLGVREAHKIHCIEVLRDCEEDYPDDRELQLAMFDKRVDKVFTWIQQALDEKVRRERGGSNGSQY